MREIKPLTTLRAIAALLVFLYHYGVLHAPEGSSPMPLQAIWAHGYLGVPMFFVLSGFLLTRIYFDPLREGSIGLGRFLLRRIARIWPLFLTLAVAQHLATWASGAASPAPDWAITLTMSQGWFAGLLYEGLPQAWSLTIEETFYVLLPGLCLVLDWFVFREDRPQSLAPAQWWRLALGLTVVVVAAAAAGEAAIRLNHLVGTDWRGFMADRDHVLRMTLAGRLPEFAVGMAVAFIHRDGRLLDSRLARLAGPATIALLVAIGAMMALKNIAPSGGQYALHLGVAIATGALILALCADHWPARWLAWTPLVYLGRISYAFYLVQLTLIATRLSRAADRVGTGSLLVLLILLLVLSAGLYELVERPARRALVRRWAPKGEVKHG